MTVKQEHAIELAHGCSLEIAPGGKQVTLSSDGGNLIVTLTPEGPRIEMDAPQVTIRNQGALALEADEITLRSRGNMVHEIGGDLEQRVNGNMKLQARDDLDISAQSAHVEAHRGGLSLKATDDLALNGLRILHNVPTEEEIFDQYRKVETFGELMACPAYDPNSPKRMERGAPKPAEDLIGGVS